MLDFLLPVIYVQLSPQNLTVRNVKSGAFLSEVPEVAISTAKPARVLDIGAAARLQSGANIVNPFAHPRSLVSDFTVAELLLKTMVQRLLKRSFFVPSPKVIMHPLGEPQGGFTQIEIRVFREMARGAGASFVVVWEGRALSDQELLSGKFPGGGRVLA